MVSEEVVQGCVAFSRSVWPNGIGIARKILSDEFWSEQFEKSVANNVGK